MAIPMDAWNLRHLLLRLSTRDPLPHNVAAERAEVYPSMSLIEMIESKPNALTVEELATIISQSPKTLYTAIKNGHLPAYRVGGSIRLDPYDVGEWLRKRRTR